jgi:hypothetical protein
MNYIKQYLPEIYYLKHKNDDTTDFVDYEKKLLKSSLSPYLYNNKNMEEFLNRLEKMVVVLFDNVNVVKNFKNYIVDKYEYKHPN